LPFPLDCAGNASFQFDGSLLRLVVNVDAAGAIDVAGRSILLPVATDPLCCWVSVSYLTFTFVLKWGWEGRCEKSKPDAQGNVLSSSSSLLLSCCLLLLLPLPDATMLRK
jgi:hypothetical protein